MDPFREDEVPDRALVAHNFAVQFLPFESEAVDGTKHERYEHENTVFIYSLVHLSTKIETRRKLFTIQKPLPPPSGFTSWLDYAVERMDTRQVWLESLYETWADDSAVEVDRDAVLESARLELRALREAAAASRGGSGHD